MTFHPTCSSTEDGPCPCTPLAGVDTCLRHTDKTAPVRLGGLAGHDGVISHPDPGDIRGIDAIPATNPARPYTPEPATVPLSPRFPARLWAFLTMARSRP